MRIQSGVLVPLGYGKYVRSDRVTSILPIEEDRAGRDAARWYLSKGKTSR